MEDQCNQIPSTIACKPEEPRRRVIFRAEEFRVATKIMEIIASELKANPTLDTCTVRNFCENMLQYY